MKKITTGFSILVLCLSSTVAQADNERTMLVLDASGSMWGQLEGVTKIEIARDALKTLVADWPEGREAGLVAYGHRRKGDCNDIETLMPVGPLDAATMNKTVSALNPKGKTPLSAAVRQAAEALKYTEEKATVVLLSDGKETCAMDPCALGSDLEKLGVDFTAHVIGFDVSKQEDRAGLRCLAENTGGQFIPAGNASELSNALEQTAKAAMSEPEPEPTPLPTAELIAPDTATKGTRLLVELKAEDGLDGNIYLYPDGKDKHVTYGHVGADKIEGYKPSKITLPAVPGKFILKWITQDKQVIAEKPLTIEDAEVTLEAPESAMMGTVLEVGLNAPDGLNGYIYLFAKGREKHATYGHVRADKIQGYQPAKIILPAVAGDFVLKWITQDKRVIAEKPLLIEQADVALEAPGSAIKGTEVEIGLQAPDGLNGYIYLFAAGKEKHMAYGHIRADKIQGYEPAKIRLPATPGDYTLKWITQDKRTIAEAPLTIADTEITLGAPEQAEKGTDLPVTLNAPDGLDGYVYLFPEGGKKHATYGYVRADSIAGYQPSRIRIPKQTGNYVLRWMTQGRELLAEQPIQVVDKITETETTDTEPTTGE